MGRIKRCQTKKNSIRKKKNTPKGINLEIASPNKQKTLK